MLISAYCLLPSLHSPPKLPLTSSLTQMAKHWTSALFQRKNRRTKNRKLNYFQHKKGFVICLNTSKLLSGPHVSSNSSGPSQTSTSGAKHPLPFSKGEQTITKGRLCSRIIGLPESFSAAATLCDGSCSRSIEMSK